MHKCTEHHKDTRHSSSSNSSSSSSTSNNSSSNSTSNNSNSNSSSNSSSTSNSSSSTHSSSSSNSTSNNSSSSTHNSNSSNNSNNSSNKNSKVRMESVTTSCQTDMSISPWEARWRLGMVLATACSQIATHKKSIRQSDFINSFKMTRMLRCRDRLRLWKQRIKQCSMQLLRALESRKSSSTKRLRQRKLSNID